jgi:hypothetical protein
VGRNTAILIYRGSVPRAITVLSSADRSSRVSERCASIPAVKAFGGESNHQTRGSVARGSGVSAEEVDLCGHGVEGVHVVAGSGHDQRAFDGADDEERHARCARLGQATASQGELERRGPLLEGLAGGDGDGVTLGAAVHDRGRDGTPGPVVGHGQASSEATEQFGDDQPGRRRWGRPEGRAEGVGGLLGDPRDGLGDQLLLPAGEVVLQRSPRGLGVLDHVAHPGSVDAAFAEEQGRAADVR